LGPANAYGTLIQVKDNAGSETQWYINIVVAADSTVRGFRYFWLEDGGTQNQSDYVGITSEQWYKFRVRYKVSGGSNDGIFQLWKDDVLTVDETGLDNDESTGVGQVNLGFVGGTINGFDSPKFYFDDIRVREDALF
jgi:hypothetical protein